MLRIDHNSPLLASCSLRIPFNDLDPAGVVWHGRFFKYFEQARARQMDEIGYGYAEMYESGFNWPVVDARIRYHKPQVLNQEIVIIAALVEWELRLKVDHEIITKAGELCARATTIQVPVNRVTNEFHLGLSGRLIECVEARLASV
jgi:acyl-CoA thioester hydrolase